MTDDEKLQHCAGCEDDFYNGNNPYNVKQCWMLEKMELQLRKKVHINQVPPWKQEPQLFPNCYKQKHYAFVKPD